MANHIKNGVDTHKKAVKNLSSPQVPVLKAPPAPISKIKFISEKQLALVAVILDFSSND
jgi:hypothetical protein